MIRVLELTWNGTLKADFKGSARDFRSVNRAVLSGWWGVRARWEEEGDIEKEQLAPVSVPDSLAGVQARAFFFFFFLSMWSAWEYIYFSGQGFMSAG